MAKGLKFEGAELRGKSLEFNGTMHHLGGASVVVEVGGTQRKATATRVIVGSAIAPGIGTIIGFMAKKKSNNVYVTIEFSDGQVLVLEAKREGDARRFAAAVASVANDK